MTTEFTIDLAAIGLTDYPKTVALSDCLENPDTRDNDHLVCPVCRFTYAHIIGISMTPNDRGTDVTMYMKCESGHEFQVEFQQWKGETTASATTKSLRI